MSMAVARTSAARTQAAKTSRTGIELRGGGRTVVPLEREAIAVRGRLDGHDNVIARLAEIGVEHGDLVERRTLFGVGEPERDGVRVAGHAAKSRRSTGGSVTARHG